MLREIVIKLNGKDYHDFLKISNEYGLSVEEKIYEMIYVYLIVQRKRFKQNRL
jgi:hypothetical protein